MFLPATSRREARRRPRERYRHVGGGWLGATENGEGARAGERSGFPAIAFTALARTEDRTRAFHAGFLAHVAKPVEPSEVVATVASVVGRTGAPYCSLSGDARFLGKTYSVVRSLRPAALRPLMTR